MVFSSCFIYYKNLRLCHTILLLRLSGLGKHAVLLDYFCLMKVFHLLMFACVQLKIKCIKRNI